MPGRVAARAGARHLVYVSGDNFPPYHYLSAEGEPRGFIVELLHALARESDLDLTIRLEPSRDRTGLIDRGEADLTAIVLNDARAQRYTHALPVWKVEREIPDVHQVDLRAVPLCLVARPDLDDSAPGFLRRTRVSRKAAS